MVVAVDTPEWQKDIIAVIKQINELAEFDTDEDGSVLTARLGSTERIGPETSKALGMILERHDVEWHPTISHSKRMSWLFMQR